VFVTAVSTLEEVRELVKAIHGPLSIAAGLAYNLNAFSINDLRALVVARVSLPSIAISATIKALLESTDALKSGVFTSIVAKGCLCSPQDIGRLIVA